MIETRLSGGARNTIRASGMTIAAFKRSYNPEDGKWRGDVCGCTDDRCVGFHHDQDDECQCLPVLLRDAHLRAVPEWLHLTTPEANQAALAALIAAWKHRLDTVWEHTRAESAYWNAGANQGQFQMEKEAAWASLMKASEDYGRTFWYVCRTLQVDPEQVNAQVARLLDYPVNATLTPGNLPPGAPTDA